MKILAAAFFQLKGCF
ncbi:hypothetical protein CLS_34180 [[Clostridium] cf. saccharolyticum K10]|nr:hypothetical protein CLS_34180 [[Clostridium] cf. saccharolyticum K10]